MKTSELITMIETAEELGHVDIEVCINDSRDGVESYPPAKGKFLQVGNQSDQRMIIVFSYE